MHAKHKQTYFEVKLFAAKDNVVNPFNAFKHAAFNASNLKPLRFAARSWPFQFIADAALVPLNFRLVKFVLDEHN